MTEELRRLVAEANRLLYMEGLATSSGHVSALDPETETVYVNPFDTPRGALRPDDVVGVTLDNEPVDPDAPQDRRGPLPKTPAFAGSDDHEVRDGVARDAVNVHVEVAPHIVAQRAERLKLFSAVRTPDATVQKDDRRALLKRLGKRYRTTSCTIQGEVRSGFAE